MATNSLHSIPHTHHHHHHSLLKPTTPPASLSFLKPTTTTTPPPSPPSLSLSLSSTSSSSSSSSTATFSLSPNTTSTTATTSTSSPSSSSAAALDDLRRHLAAADFRQADEETRRLLIVLAGESAQKRGYVFFSEVQFIAESDLKAIDELWTSYSGGRFGYSVQRRIFGKVNRDFTRFFIKVGWMKKLDTEVEQYNYRSFPSEFVWELNDDTPEGHLPLTNALRGTQLLNCLLNHPAFEAEQAEAEDEDQGDGGRIGGGGGGGLLKGLREGAAKAKPATGKTLFKPDYSF